MAATAWKHFATLSSNTRTGGSVSWTNPSNAGASDNVYATCSLTSNGSHWLWGINPGFTESDIPSTATITGIEFQVERKASYGLSTEGTLTRSYYKPIKANAETGTAQTVDGDIPSSDTTATIGGDGNMMGATFTAAEAIDSNTGFAFAHFDDQHTTASISVDDMQIRFHYTLPSTRRRCVIFFRKMIKNVLELLKTLPRQPHPELKMRGI